ncbi:MAG: LysM peptidoglycan-binding domain-containing protein [Myxococcales bacterium]|nr:LysM peptidoglycan-binding domain-containing protein [Myxococcales bacterium]
MASRNRLWRLVALLAALPGALLLAGSASAQSIAVTGDKKAEVPEEYLVEKGDTLWDICEYYFSEPWVWPTVWALNPHITNPHWIYPGDILRLRRGAGEVVDADGVVVQPFNYTIGSENARQITLNEGFIVEDEIEKAGNVAYSPLARRYLALDDLVYLEMKNLDEVRVGDRFTVYRVEHDVTHPETGAYIGQKIRVTGMVEVETVDKYVARARIVSSFTEIERGNPITKEIDQYAVVNPRQNLLDLKGTVVDALPPARELGQFDTVFLDKGAKDGVQIGNRFFVMRRGDGRLDLERSVDQRLPWEQIGEAMVVAARDRTATAIVTRSALEIRRGDRVIMQRHY